ncbi:MAG: carbamoyltransferase HypF [Candidatus Moraniibacteriota bacterium]
MKSFFRFTITGVVQGVGFRPFVHNACVQAGLVGYVQNIGNGVIVVVNDAVMLENILKQAPPNIRIDTMSVEKINGHFADFRIYESSGTGFSEIPPDSFLCDDCLAELLDTKNRRHNYFFLTCTLCGPRFTMAIASPYDRITTAMRDFDMCAHCAKEYETPSNRRFHAQTIACHDCGPELMLWKNGRQISKADDQEKIRLVASALAKGEIISMKGIGGFHLIGAATKKTVQTLNRMTGRTDKPYAVLCRDIAMARTIATITPIEEATLASPARPIVLVQKNVDAPPVSELDTIGIMLSYTALHILLFSHYNKPLICTSSNRMDAPITTEREEQHTPLILDHTRTIKNATDDSVVKIIHDTTFLLRRSRGFVPRSIAIQSNSATPLLALGAEMNSTFALYDGRDRITLSPHLGNTSHPDTLAHYKTSLNHFLAYTNITPQAILCDAHPEYRTTLYGAELAKQLRIPLIPIQHHRAHAFGVAYEHGLDDFVAIVCDGLGYGDDGTIWGGEIFENNIRIGHLETQRQLGGDSATRYPHKMLYALLRTFLSPEETNLLMKERFSPVELEVLEKQLTHAFNAPLTSSCGRILDAAAALLGLYMERTYDGRGAMLLEAHSSNPFSLSPVIDGSILRTTPLFAYLVEHIHEDTGRLAATVQHYLAEGLYAIAAKKQKPIVWAGGCAYNRIMSTYFLERGVLVNREVPSGDGGISFGQISAYLANSGNNITGRH